MYEKYSPSVFAKNFKTPTLVTHGELEYRIPVGSKYRNVFCSKRLRVRRELRETI
jgi:dipeptidyl aminopeptidase/acylaminoacyl peptidase